MFCLPDGLGVSGITAWAARLAGALVAAGRRAVLVAHPEPPRQARLAIPIDPRVRLVRPECPSLRDANGDLDPFLVAYREVFRQLTADRGQVPVILCPSLLGDAYGIAAALSREMPERLRTVGWQHADIPYDAQVLRHYEPLLVRFVGVSATIASDLRRALPGRAADVRHIPYGVPVPDQPPRRRSPGQEGLRLIYTGRIEHHQKRVIALIHMSDELDRQGIPHRLLLVGEGPAAVDVDSAIARGRRPRRIARAPAAGPDEVAARLDESDAFVLASRWEGLSVAMLEAMARGCVPVVTRVRSGAEDAVADGLTGVLVDAGGDAPDEAVGAALADGVARLAGSDLGAVSRAAWETVRERFDLRQHVSAAAALFDEVGAAPPRAWPAHRPCAFSGAPGAGGSGTVPADAAERLRALLRRLAGRSIVVHGAGRHTAELASVFEASPVRFVALADDDRARWGTTLLGRPVVAPHEAGRTGATDVVISTWLHAEAVWSRRAVYEEQGLRVHRLYG